MASLDGGRLEDAATAVWGDGRPGDCPALTVGCHTPCSFQGTCYYGRECCCGECFPALGCRCFNGVTECFYLESCQAATCTSP